MTWIVVLPTFSAILVVTFLVLSYYTPLRRTPYYVLLTGTPSFVCPAHLLATIGLFIPFSIVLLLPIDLASTTADRVCDTSPETCHRPWFYLNERTLLLCWRIGYWTTFALTWVIFPILQSYTESGHRSPRRRLISALRQNLRYQAIVLGIFGLGLLYILLTVKISSFSDFSSLLIALAYTYGLLLTIFCMGHGLVSIPRRMWIASSLDTELREIERAAVSAWEQKADAEDQVALLSAEIAGWERAVEGRDDSQANWVRELALQNPDGGAERAASIEGRHLDNEYLSGLTRRATKGHYKLMKAQIYWRWILRRAGHLYDLKSSSETSVGKIDWKLSSPGRVGRLLPGSVQYLWYLRLLPWWRKALGIFTAIVSIVIVWSEMVHNWSHPVLSLVGIIIRSTGQNWFLLELLSISFLMYMAYATYSSFMRLKILNIYSLTSHYTDPVSILFYASYLCRLTVPLTYNFTTLLAPPPDPDDKLTTFSIFLGKSINLTPLGGFFNAWFPLFILLPILFTTFDLYNKIKGVLGLGDLGGWIIDDDDDEDRGEVVSVVEGRGILKRELGLATSNYTRARPTRVLGSHSGDEERTPRITRYTDEEEDEDSGENFFTATGHRLWNSISNRVDDLRSEGSNEHSGRGVDDTEEGGLLGRIPRPKWLGRGESGVSVWRLPRWGRSDEGRVVL